MGDDDGDAAGVGETEGEAVMEGRATEGGGAETAATRASGEEYPRDDARPDAAMAWTREPSLRRAATTLAIDATEKAPALPRRRRKRTLDAVRVNVKE